MPAILEKYIESAEGKALQEGFIKPEKKHYDYVFNLYKELKLLNPKILETVINVASKNREIKIESDSQSEKVFNHVWNEITKGYQDNIENAIYAGEKDKTKKISPETFRQKMHVLLEKYFKEKVIELKKDPRIVFKFEKKKDILDKYIDLATTSFLDYLKAIDYYLS